MGRFKLTLEAVLLMILGTSFVYSKESHKYQIDAHICRGKEIISSTHVLVSDNKKLYYAPKPELVFWYEVSLINNKINIMVEYRRNRESTVTWEKGPSFDVSFDKLTTIKLAAENGEEMDWQILVRQTDNSHGMLNLENTNIRKKCIEQ